MIQDIEQNQFFDEQLINIIKQILQSKAGAELKQYIATNKPSFGLIESQFQQAISQNNENLDFHSILKHIIANGVQRVFIRVLFAYLKKNKDKLDLKQYQQQGIAKLWKNLTSQELEDFIELFELRNEITNADLIKNFEQLIEIKKYDEAIQFYQAVNLDLTQFDKLMNAMSTNNDAGRAADYIKRFQYDPQRYPKIIERLQKSCVRYIYKEFTWYKGEEMLKFYPSLLGYLCEDAYFKGQKLEALSIIKRNNLLDQIQKKELREQIEQDFKQGFIEQENILFTQDAFKPVDEIINKQDHSFLHCSDFNYQENQIYFIDKIDNEYKQAWEQIHKSKEVGFDSEHITPMTKLDNIGLQVLLVQIAIKDNAYLFDFKQLKDKEEFKQDIKQFLENNEILKCGLSIKDDITNVVEQLNIRPLIIRSIIELSICFKNLEGDPKTRSLAYLSEYYFKKPLSKLDTCSNWALRPLRKAQLHYAALDSIASLYSYLKMKEINNDIVEQEKDILLMND